MMYLLDTHALIWFLFEPSKLPRKVLELIESAERVWISPCSLWEIAIKQSIRKLDIQDRIEEIGQACLEQEIEVLDLKFQHFETIKQLPDVHRDPFDRLIVAQAKCEGLTIVTRDANIAKYDVHTVWDKS